MYITRNTAQEEADRLVAEQEAQLQQEEEERQALEEQVIEDMKPHYQYAASYCPVCGTCINSEELYKQLGDTPETTERHYPIGKIPTRLFYKRVRGTEICCTSCNSTFIEDDKSQICAAVGVRRIPALLALGLTVFTLVSFISGQNMQYMAKKAEQQVEYNIEHRNDVIEEPAPEVPEVPEVPEIPEENPEPAPEEQDDGDGKEQADAEHTDEFLLSDFLSTAMSIASVLLPFMGMILVLSGVVQIAKGLMSGLGDTNYVMAISTMIAGIAIAAAAFLIQ